MSDLPTMCDVAYALFQTSIGSCGIAWGAQGIAGVQLPEASPSATVARLLRAQRQARNARPGPDQQRIIDDIVALLAGQARDLRYARLDVARAPPFHQRVFDVVRDIPPGRTRT